MPARRFSEDQIRAAARSVNEGVLLRDAAAAMGCSTSYLSEQFSRLRRAGDPDAPPLHCGRDWPGTPPGGWPAREPISPQPVTVVRIRLGTGRLGSGRTVLEAVAYASTQDWRAGRASSRFLVLPSSHDPALAHEFRRPLAPPRRCRETGKAFGFRDVIPSAADRAPFRPEVSL